VHLALFDEPPDLGETKDSLLVLRALVQKELEPFRAQKKSSLDAHVILEMGPLEVSPEQLADLFIVSKVTVMPKSATTPIRIEDASGHKCARCWKWTPDEPLDRRCLRALQGKT
jgi:hypothetical protein